MPALVALVLLSVIALKYLSSVIQHSARAGQTTNSGPITVVNDTLVE